MTIDLGDLTDKQLNRLCYLCLKNEIAYSTSTCEGSYCEQALQYLEEDEEFELECLIEEKFGDKFAEIHKLLNL